MKNIRVAYDKSIYKLAFKCLQQLTLQIPTLKPKFNPINDNRQVNDLMKIKTCIYFKLIQLFALERIIQHERNNEHPNHIVQ